MECYSFLNEAKHIGPSMKKSIKGFLKYFDPVYHKRNSIAKDLKAVRYGLPGRGATIDKSIPKLGSFATRGGQHIVHPDLIKGEKYKERLYQKVKSQPGLDTAKQYQKFLAKRKGVLDTATGNHVMDDDIINFLYKLKNNKLL